MNKINIFQETMDLQIKAREIGLDWLEVKGIIDKIKEETLEVEEAINDNNANAIKEELGDLIFTYLCLARHLKFNPEEIIDSANIKFKKRLNLVLDIMKKENKDFANPKEMEKYWRAIKNQN